MTDKYGFVIFDGDDTLWKTQELYDYAKKRFERLMQKEGFLSENTIELFDEIDSERVKLTKFAKTRFLESLLITYGILCGKNNRNWNVSIESKLRILGLTVFNRSQLYDETVPVLDKLYKYFYLVLYTHGDKEIQKKKILALDKKTKSYFLKIIILEQKNTVELRKVINDLKTPRRKIWVVGNSIKSDINPALKLGLKAILIPQGSWKYEEDKLYLGNVTIVSSLMEAADIILKSMNKKNAKKN